MWEIYSLGKTPYPGMTNQETMEKVLHGYLQPIPEGCPKEISVCMTKCWNQKMENRPTFSQMLSNLNQFFSEPQFETVYKPERHPISPQTIPTYVI